MKKVKEIFKRFIKWVGTDNKNLVAFKKGRDARINGESRDSNPYKLNGREYVDNSSQFLWWDGGWYAVNERLKKDRKLIQ